ncbi:MAG: formylglycine-generating enzyme family protein [Pirellulaceae bacterium]|nr:formylglycine-generating enzyme family protein [Pirellulaceae bacterium]
MTPIRRPSTIVLTHNAQEFCRRLSEKDGGTYRLPTEAEWEYACRAGTTTANHFGNKMVNADEYAWTRLNTRNAQEDHAHQVGLKAANGFGLHDMHGNVHEWCNDWYDANYYRSSPRSDPAGPSTGTERVMRGGAWANGPEDGRSAIRARLRFTGRGVSRGFRVVRSPNR